MAGSHASFTLKRAIDDYLVPGSDAHTGCDLLASGGALNVNVPHERRWLQAALSVGFPAILVGMARDGHLNRRTD